MIPYETLVQTIEDWRAGKRPAPLTPVEPAVQAQPLEEVEAYDGESMELESGEALEDTGRDSTMAYAPAGYDPQAAAGPYGAFDVENDLGSYFVAYARLHGTVDPERAQIFGEYGIRDEEHLQEIHAAIEHYVSSPEGQERWGGIEGITQLQQEAMARVEAAAPVAAEGQPELEPIEGVDVRQWAYVQANVVSGVDLETVLAQLGIEPEVWMRAGAEWNARMERDPTGQIGAEYTGAYEALQQAAAAEQAHVAVEPAAAEPTAVEGEPEATPTEATGEPPITIERWVEIEQALVVLMQAGHAHTDILAEFELSVDDWNAINEWWTQHLQAHGHDDDGAMLARYQQLQEFYNSHFSSAMAEG